MVTSLAIAPLVSAEEPASNSMKLNSSPPPEEEVRRKLGDDFRWIQYQGTCYRHPQGVPIFDNRRADRGLSAPGVFAGCDSVRQVEEFLWPDCDFLVFDEWISALEMAGEVYRASGFWCPFSTMSQIFLG